jgi:hypothetical protein
LQESIAILADNKKVALKQLDDASAFYKKAIEAAKHEPGDFKYAIEKAETWLNYTNRFKEGLIALSQTSGDEFQKYMKENFLYII